MRHLIVVVPGIGGSVLEDDQGVVWGDRARRVVGVVAHPDRLHADRPMKAVGLMNTLGFIAPFKVSGYEGLLRKLATMDGRRLTIDVAVEGKPRDPRADIVALPYDFRLGVVAAAERLAAEVDARLRSLSPTEQARRVIVIGHSLGGLVARYWAAAPEQARRCAAILTVGTPHRGASKALDWLVNGVGFGGDMRTASSGTLTTTRRMLTGTTRALRSWPGAFDLLPIYTVIEDPATDRHLNAADLAGTTAPGYASDPAYAFQAKRALALHMLITQAWGAPVDEPGTRPPVIPFLARDHGTPHAAQLKDGRLHIRSWDPHWQPSPGWQGDGTVPALSAVPPELAPQEKSHPRHPVFERHVPMASASSVVEVVRHIVGGDLSAVRGESHDRLRLGADLDDATVLGDPLPVRVRLLDGSGPADRHGIALRVTAQLADGSGDPHQLEVREDGDGWSALLAPPSAGLWEVQMQAVNPTGAEPPILRDTVAVLDPGTVALATGA